MGSRALTVIMITPTVFTLFVLAGSVLCDTSSHPEPGVQHSTLVEPLVSQQSNVVDTQYYSQYPEQQYQGEQFPPTGSGYYDYSTLGQELTDRTDGTILGGLTIGVLLTIFLAAMLGAMVAPIITGAVTRVSDAIPVPEITIPEINFKGVEAVDEETEEEDEEPSRALKEGLNLVKRMVSPRVKRG